MTILSVESLSKQYAERVLFSDLNFGMQAGERLAVIGVNGSGKTSLLRIIAGLEEADTGRVVMANQARSAYLPQVPRLDAYATVMDAVFASDVPMLRLLHEYEQCSAELGQHPDDPALMERLHRLTDAMDAQNAWEAEAATRTMLSQLGIADLADVPIATLSGGQRKRVAMARTLLAEPDLLILDEPTNHIDTDTIVWLEQYLRRIKSAVLLVTHDRYFLDRIVGRMLELDRGQVNLFEGNYAAYLDQKAMQAEQEQAAELARRNLLRKELAWLRRGAQGRTTKQKAHVQRVHELAQQQSEAPPGSVEIDLASRRIGKKVIEVHHLSKAYGAQQLLAHFSLDLQRRDRIGIIGPNGSGKSTLLNMLAGRVQPDQGTIVLGETVHMAYYDQESSELDPNQRVIEYVRDAAEQIRDREGGLVAAGRMLERFLFPQETQWTAIGRLSGGERRRLYLLRTLMLAPNVLLLDEPTNDLDIQTLTVLEDYLDEFAGAVIVVSHDRYFLDRCVERLLVFEGDGTISDYPGGYSSYEEHRAVATPPPVATPRKTPPPPRAPAASSRLNYKEKRELNRLESEISKLEAEQARIEEQLLATAEDYTAYQRIADQLAELNARLEAAMERWAELAEREEKSG
jgi:ABC transport system ATP-binding/permease protein